MGQSDEATLSVNLKRRAETPPNDSGEPVQKAPRMQTSSSSSNADHEPPSPPPSIADKLPCEIWMSILESLDHSDHIARPSYVNCFVQAIIADRVAEADLVPELPAFEKEVWRATRPYYAINKTSRQAAHQVFLSGVLLQSCSSPLNRVPLKRNRGRREPHAIRTSIPPPFYPSSALARMRPAISANGILPEPTYMPLELFDYQLFHDALRHEGRQRKDAVMHARFEFMVKLYDEHYERLAPAGVNLLSSVRRVDLLGAAPYEHLMKSAGVFAELLRNSIERIWKDLGVQDGVVRVWY